MEPLGDLSPETYRAYAYRVADWIATYLSEIEDYPVLSRVRPGDVKRALPAQPPEGPESLDRILKDFEEVVVPGITHWNHPRFHAYFSNTGSVPGILAESLIAALNVNGMLWRTSPVATELESVALDWLRQMMGLPEGFHGHLHDTASVSTLVALTAARHRATGGTVRELGLAQGPRLRHYASEHAHSSVEKAGIVLGLGQQGMRAIPSDENHRMRPEVLAEAIRDDRAQGWVPMAVTATLGTTATTSSDPVGAIADLCHREKIWLHVDAAYGGAMAIAPEFRPLFQGWERGDSLVVNPHKWIFTPMDCSALYFRDPEVVREAFSLVPSYLMTPEDGETRNLMDYGPALGRRFRALKLWMVLRTYGSQGIAERIRFHVDLAQGFAEWVDDHEEWERLAPAPMSLVLFRHRPRGVDGEEALEAHNRALMDTVNETGRVFLSHSMVDGRFAMRLAVGNIRTERRHLEDTWSLLRQTAAKLEASLRESKVP